MKGYGRVQKPIDRQAFCLEIDAQVTAKKQVGLPRLDGDTGGNPARVEIPRFRFDNVLGDDSTTFQRALPALDGQDPVHQHQGLVR
jgi:hypothetical protein